MSEEKRDAYREWAGRVLASLEPAADGWARAD